MAQPGALNLNNEVVKMRKEVKRIRVLVIRKLVRSVSRLKSKKGTEDALLKNQRRAQRLLEEIHAMKELKPDVVTKSALDDDINFEKICKKPDSTATERAIARLAVHPVLKKKIDLLKAAVQAFKDARQNATETESSKKNSEEQQCADTSRSGADARASQQRERTSVGEQKGKEAKLPANGPKGDSKEKRGKMECAPKAVGVPDSPSRPREKSPTVPPECPKTPAASEMKTSSHSVRKAPEGAPRGDSESEDGASEEEQEYFDDSTEERFYKQSSVSEDSDSGDDFFIGKVRRSRKKEGSGCSSAREKPLQNVLPKESAHEPLWNVRNDQSKPLAGARKLESVFFHSLSGSKSSGRDLKEQVPKSRAPDCPEDEPQIKNQFKKNMQRGLGSIKQQSHTPLHPSWEASRRRKEQQSKITVFQGKKITFDD